MGQGPLTGPRVATTLVLWHGCCGSCSGLRDQRIRSSGTRTRPGRPGSPCRCARTRRRRARCTPDRRTPPPPPPPAGLVRDECSQLGEGPAGMGGPLGLAKPYPLADARQVFQGDSATGTFCLGHHMFRDLVVDVPRPSRLLAPPFLQAPFDGRGVLALQLGTQASLAQAGAVQLASGHDLAVRGGGDVRDAQVDPEEVHQVRVQGCFGHLTGGVQKPHAVPLQQIGLAVLEERPLGAGGACRVAAAGPRPGSSAGRMRNDRVPSAAQAHGNASGRGRRCVTRLRRGLHWVLRQMLREPSQRPGVRPGHHGRTGAVGLLTSPLRPLLPHVPGWS
ncbi:hypothetical protein OK006_8843 [Actinobacteria bacterium OK006]|nr:hypothetical protein OK006_8843 [Actinobacteria bacterium OK006]